MTTAMILNIILATAIFATIVGLLSWAIATQSRDDGPIQVRDAPARQRRADRAAHIDHPLAGQSERRRGQRSSVTAS
jgi:hypothetical protein